MGSDEQITEYLNCVASSQVLGRSERRLGLLEYLLRKELNGEGETLKAYSIGLDVLNKSDTFDPTTDSSVRVEMGRLRTALSSFENSTWAQSDLAVEIPTGSYRPKIRLRSDVQSSQPPAPVAPKKRTAIKMAVVSAIASALVVTLLFLMFPSNPAPPPEESAGIRISMANFEGDPFMVSQVETALRQSLVRNQSFAVFSQQTPGVGPVDFSLRGLVNQVDRNAARISIELLNVHTNRIVWTKSLRVAAREDLTEQVSSALGNELNLRLLGASKAFLEGRDPASLTNEQLFLMATWVPGPTASNSLVWEQERVEIIRLALARDPNLGTAHSVLADKLAQLANFYPDYDTPATMGEIETHINRATELEAYHPDVMFNIAQAYWHMGRIKDSHSAMRRVLDLDPGHDIARFLSTVIPYTCEVPPPSVIAEAVAFDSGISPDNPIRWITLTWIAWMQLNGGNLDAALEAKQQASLIFETPYTFVGHAMLLNKMDRTDEAAIVLKRQELNWPSISVTHFASVTMPRLCSESSNPNLLLQDYENLSQALEKTP